MGYKYMRDGLPDKYGFLPLQDRILEIAKYIDEFCESEGIDYCLMGGSALGAVRHKGFIPWDDDLDIFMTPENYEKFRKCFNEKGDKARFYLQEWGIKDGMVTVPKLRMNGTSYIEESLADQDIHHGIFVDIFILHNCPDSRISQLHQCFWAKYLILRGLANRNYKRHGGFIGFVVGILRLFPDKFLVEFALKQVYKYRNKNTAYLCNFLGKAVFKQGIYKREWFFPTEKTEFEKTYLRIPANVREFLSFRFGNYMEVPSAEKIKYAQHAKYWSVSEDYKSYSESYTDRFVEENRLV